LPSILQIGDTEFTHFKQPREALNTGSHNAHFMFVTPSDDHSFTLYTINHYTGPDPEFFDKLSPSRKVESKAMKRPYDQRRLSPFRGNVRTEDIACQGTQPLLDQRKEKLATSDKGVILIRKIILNAIRAVKENRVPKGVLRRSEANQLVTIDSFTGVRPRGLV
jgi:hypothetical protein